MTRSTRIVALALALAVAWPAAAFALVGTTGRTATSTASPVAPAATATATSPAAPAVPATLDIQVWPSEADGVDLVVSAELPATVQLPASVRIPVPAGFTLGWVGEVFGGDVANDVERPYTTEDGQGGKVIVVTATKSHVIQYEGLLAPLTADGMVYTASLAWVQSAPAAAQSWAVKMGSATSDVWTDPAYVGDPQVNAVGERLYSLPSTQLALGTAQHVTVSFARGNATAAASSSGSQGAASSTLLIVLFALLAVAVVALAVVAARSKRRAS